MAFIKQEDILRATNGGLDIILSYYPQANAALSNERKEFKIRTNERTPSARLKQLKEGTWVVTDFGDDQVPRNGILICQKEEEISFREAIVLLAGRYKIGGISSEQNKPDFEKRPATKEEAEGEYFFDAYDQVPENDLLVLGPKVNQNVCKEYHIFSLKSYTQIKNREALIWKSNENYPIFLVEHDTWKKIYQPKNPEKQFRFRYIGEKPKDLINGLEQLIKANKELEKEQTEGFEEGTENNKIKKYPEAIICSGESDALNVASLGYKPLWFNSETANLTGDMYRRIMNNCETLYYIPDLDETGVKAAVKLGMQYLEIRIVWLPDKLRTYRDMRGNPRKDFKDYIEIWPKTEDLNKLLKVAKPMRFWDEEYGEKGVKYHFNNEFAYHFLSCNGFYQFENKNTKEGYMFIRIDRNIVSEIKAKNARAFIKQFLIDRYMPVPLRNMIYKTNQLNEASLENLPSIDIDFTDFDKHTQFLFFTNKTWKVTASAIDEFKSDDISKYVWQEEVIQHKVKLLKDPFKITFNNETSEYDIEITDQTSLFFNFLINGSRIHWRQELENRISGLTPEEKTKYLTLHKFKIDGEKLTEEEIFEQKQHLINKIFSIGYLLHRYKDPARPWCVFSMDNHIGDTGMSFGRSGKSLCYKAMRHFMKSIMLPGRNEKLTDNPHIYDRVTEHTDYILIDDANAYLKFDFFFEPLTGPLVVNPKNNQSYEIPFEHVPKFCITSNFTLRNIDPSTEGRILYTVFSDYYHIKTDEADYNEDRTVNEDFGKNLFFDYTEDEWNADFNFFANCIKFYLSVPSPHKINPPMNNVTRRNLKTEMGEMFENWADVYFSTESGRLDDLIPKEPAFKDYIDTYNQHKWTMNKFTRSLKAWCRFHNYIIDPIGLRNKAGRIIRKRDGKACEMIYIQTQLTIKKEAYASETETDLFAVPINDDEKLF